MLIKGVPIYIFSLNEIWQNLEDNKVLNEIWHIVSLSKTLFGTR